MDQVQRSQGDVDAADTDKVRRQFRADAQTIKTRTNCSRCDRGNWPGDGVQVQEVLADK